MKIAGREEAKRNGIGYGFAGFEATRTRRGNRCEFVSFDLSMDEENIPLRQMKRLQQASVNNAYTFLGLSRFATPSVMEKIVVERGC
jgi:hypothetical protein